MPVLPMNDVVNVTVNLSPRSAVRNGFNLSLLLCDSGVLSAETRVEVYSSLEAIAEKGFTTKSPEYVAAQLYFGQSTNPGKVAIGFWDSANETLAEAIAACRVANRDWYGVAPLGVTKGGEFGPVPMTDIDSAAAYVEAATPATVMFATVDLATMAALKGKAYRRTLGVVSENRDIAVAILGWAMGANTGLARSAYTLNNNTLVGVSVDALTEAQVSDARAANGNVYVNIGATYNWFQPGTTADGTWFDEMINLDMLSNDVQLSVCDVLNKANKVSQTESGVAEIINAFIPALDKAVNTGFVARGIWNGPSLLTLEQGDAIEKGYLVLSESVNAQAPADREKRLAPPIYIMLKLAGAIHSVVIQVNVNR